MSAMDLAAFVDTTLVGKKAIEKFCQRKFETTIMAWIRSEGFPAEKIDGVWHSDKMLIIAWYRDRIEKGRSARMKNTSCSHS
ncbi:MAG: hypothetical protein ABIN58_12725 [candidate division WOR-3 bacterium]